MQFLELSVVDGGSNIIKSLFNPFAIVTVFPRNLNTPGLGDVKGGVISIGPTLFSVLESPERIQKLIKHSTKDAKGYKLALTPEFE